MLAEMVLYRHLRSYTLSGIVLVMMGFSADTVYQHCKTGITVQAWTGPEGCRRLRLPDFNTPGT